ncbi:alpha/beta hydrolase [uncultured Chitinophaga sp.]|jgi:Esterase/lipase|uniref:alpha/beta hydrolase n=1 Tax=uncultured Chitinophaga sp. TaxID=339340 RepID=UPI0026346593|nr:alpha/beta hydrolase [uncultured Chitinophaga sp.]
MNIRHYLRPLLLLATVIALRFHGYAQTSPVQKIFPEGTIVHPNISYANDTLKKHLLDIYLPPSAGNNTPLIVWIHGGAWMLNDKYADMSYMKETIRGFINKGYALASIDYRYSTTAVFPAQIQDCNEALEYLYQHAGEYKIDKHKIALIGFSAGGHLASLLALSANNQVKEFYPAGMAPHFKIKCVLDYYGPADLIALAGSTAAPPDNEPNPLAILLGAAPLKRPDLAKKASPASYVDKDDPPFFIVQGEKDASVPYTQSVLLSSWLTVSGVKNQLTIVPGAPHYGVMFDAENIRQQLFAFLETHLK